MDNKQEEKEPRKPTMYVLRKKYDLRTPSALVERMIRYRFPTLTTIPEELREEYSCVGTVYDLVSVETTWENLKEMGYPWEPEDEEEAANCNGNIDSDDDDENWLYY